jgi:hypothetical protein
MIKLINRIKCKLGFHDLTFHKEYEEKLTHFHNGIGIYKIYKCERCGKLEVEYSELHEIVSSKELNKNFEEVKTGISLRERLLTAYAKSLQLGFLQTEFDGLLHGRKNEGVR